MSVEESFIKSIVSGLGPVVKHWAANPEVTSQSSALPKKTFGLKIL